LENLSRGNSLIAKISLIAKLLQQHFANSEPRGEISVFPKAASSSLGFVVAIGDRPRSLLRSKSSLW